MPDLPPCPLVDFRHLTVIRGDRPVLRNFSLQFHQGEHVVILGPNGSGKSTLIKLMTAELYPHAGGENGRFRLFGREDWGLEELRQQLGIVALDLLQHLSHEVTAREVTARDMVLSGFFNSLGLWPHHRVTPAQERRARQLLRFLEIGHLARRPLSAMSSGEQRRALIGRALVHDPQLLILDEPTNSLDPGAVHEFHAILRKLIRSGKSLVLVTHQVADILPEIERVILMKHGRIVADGPKAKTLSSAALSRLFGQRLRLVQTRDCYELLSR
jgi:iron complex transport system ATP-binding protein